VFFNKSFENASKLQKFVCPVKFIFIQSCKNLANVLLFSLEGQEEHEARKTVSDA
jgi:hypothetical protein